MNYTQIIIAAIPPIFSLLSLMVTGFITILTLKINKNLSNAQEINNATHILVNSNMAIQLKNAMNLANEVASLTKTKKDIDDAIEAGRLYDEHLKKQSLVDNQ